MKIAEDLKVQGDHIFRQNPSVFEQSSQLKHSAFGFFSFLSLGLFLHPNSPIPPLYLLFPLNLSPVLFCCLSMGSLPLLLFLLLLSSSVSSPFPLTLPLQYMSLAIPPSSSLKQKSWLPSYLKPPCSNANHDQKKQELTFPWLVAIFSASLLPHGFGRVMYLPASKQRVA